MSRLLLGILLNYNFLLFTLSLSSAPNHLFTPTPINNGVREIARLTLQHIKPFFGGNDDCDLVLNQIYHAESQVVGQDVAYKFDLKIMSDGHQCTSEIKTCMGIKILAFSSSTCATPFQPCYKLIDEDQILCIPDLTVEPSENPGSYIDILDPSFNPIIKNIAQESTKFIYHLFNTTNPCPLHLVDIISAKEQAIKGITYELEMHVETNQADLDCNYLIKHCRKLKVHQPLSNFCPLGKQFCLVPLDLKDASCTEINAIPY